MFEDDGDGGDLSETLVSVTIAPGPHEFGPENGTLWVRTGRAGAAAVAGHDLLIHVTAWEATLDVGEDPAQASIVFERGRHVAAGARGRRRDAGAGR